MDGWLDRFGFFLPFWSYLTVTNCKEKSGEKWWDYIRLSESDHKGEKADSPQEGTFSWHTYNTLQSKSATTTKVRLQFSQKKRANYELQVKSRKMWKMERI